MKKIFISAILLVSAPLLSGCFGLFGGGDGDGGRGAAAVMMSSDDGEKFEARVQVDEKKTIANVEVISMEISPINPKVIYVGTKKKGLFTTQNGGENWAQLKFPPQKIYGIALDPQDAQTLYATGVMNKFAKIYKSIDGGVKWDEIYNEPLQKSVVTALAIDPRNRDVLYAGTSAGIIIKTDDAGASWRNIHDAKSPITTISFDSADSQTVYFVKYQRGLLKTRDGGTTVVDFTENTRYTKQGKKRIALSNGRVSSLAIDPKTSGTLYIGTNNGVYRSTDYAKTWSRLNVIGSAQKLAANAIAIDPHNTQEMLYAVARTVYRSSQNMTEWTPVQVSTSRIPAVIRFDPTTAGTIYIGLKKEK